MKVESYEVLKDAISRHFGRETVTNCFLDKQVLEREIEEGTLSVCENEGGVYIFRERDGYRIMYFYLSSRDVPLIEIPECTVCEIPFRERDEGLKHVIERFEHLGFERRFYRVRLLKKVDEVPAAAVSDDTPATLGEAEKARDLIVAAFDKRTGCIPTVASFADDVKNGHVLVRRDGGNIIGLVHFEENGNFSDIRHVAVDASQRGRGIASSLVEAYTARHVGRYRVWAREDNASARRVYEKNGYSPDGMRSAVLYFDHKDR